MRNESERRSHDEIDLFELLEGLWRQKLLIILSTVIVTAGAVAYALLATPIYEAKVVVQPPTQSNIAQLNYGRGGDSGLAVLSVKDVYDVYLRNLLSESLRREFFRKVYLPSLQEGERQGSQDDLYGRMNSILTVAVTSKETPSRYYVMASLPVAEQAAQWVVQYVQMAGEHAKREVIKDVRGDVMVKASNLEQQITAGRETARKQREDQIIQLTEALRVAESIGLERPPIISNSLSSEVSAGMDGTLTYMRGSKALRAEIENLRNRASDDPFIDNLRARQEAIAFYRTLELDPGVIEMYRQDGAIELPDRPVKPKKQFIVVLGVIAGLVLGISIALIRHMWPTISRRVPPMA
ncbi:LPS O-antigen chain length determinant protein WzzB [Pseudomonas sp. H9]|uniref:LPS O-antigen chain length determinant protein WzzB n=1 Tax=Pseudomonas sp. H9 TaxID=483968 RepID=UPI001057B9DF|nr:Wzz/FepE/Etk N-terminal domain-containing protein [Pseudomonas sp. H9]TDF81186.1 O-antigen chain length regulator [Pseudomonas sp. H9]